MSQAQHASCSISCECSPELSSCGFLLSTDVSNSSLSNARMCRLVQAWACVTACQLLVGIIDGAVYSSRTTRRLSLLLSNCDDYKCQVRSTAWANKHKYLGKSRIIQYPRLYGRPCLHARLCLARLFVLTAVHGLVSGIVLNGTVAAMIPE